jgi:hypothetical protein
MTIFNEISAQDKVNALNMYKKNALSEIFRLCVFLGIDTETFDPSTYQSDETLPMGDSYQLSELCKRVVNINNKLSSL